MEGSLPSTAPHWSIRAQTPASTAAAALVPVRVP